MSDPVLSVRDLHVRFGSKRGVAHVVRGVSYDLHAGETLALVGESGSGKSVSTLALTKLIPMPPGRIDGEVHFGGRELVAMSEAELRSIRGNDIGFVFQDPMTSLNPVHPIGRQLTEGMRHHLGLSASAARDRAVELLSLVGIPDAANRLDAYPHQFSGGMRQRVVIAIGLSCEPKVLIADEATTALDVTTQAQIVDLVERLQEELGLAVVWITHDLGVVAGIADRVMVMYAGEIVEEADVDDLYGSPRHPYTVGLLGSLPVLGADEPGELTTIHGLPPDPTAMPPGCAFHPRCEFRDDDRCRDEHPPLRDADDAGDGHRVRSFYEVPADVREAASTSSQVAEAPPNAGDPLPAEASEGDR
ncbi:MAG: ABC transporter ATP-binding protein [Actinobacteria bacterium]|nr:ABC transporter ATP-binding protein [Actinomycetota bacterium]